MGDPTTDALIDRWIRGEADAGEELGKLYLRRAKEFAVRLCKQTIDADEIAAEAVACGLDGLRAGQKPDQFTLWIKGIIRNLHRRRLRENREDLLPPDEVDPRSGPLTVAIQGDAAALLDRMTPELPPTLKEVLELHRRGLSREKMAEALKVPLKNIHMRFVRLHGYLKEGLSRHYTTMVVRGPVRWEDIRKLRPSFRDAVIVRHLENRPASEAARRLSIPPDTLEARLRTAYDALHCDEASDYSLARADWIRSSRA
jgi:DNA-directed RNA polymerase specialized sigma24 family protein